jgi:hypothetical protein
MKTVEFTSRTGFCGMDNKEIVEFEDDVTTQHLDDYAWDLAQQNAESYGIYPYYEDSDDEDESISQGIEGSWKFI